MWLVVTLVPLPSEVLVTCRPMSKHWAWFPSEVHTNTGRLCSAGSRGALFPNVHAPMQPSDSLPPSVVAPVPLADGLPRCGRLFCAAWADDTCARQRVVRRRRASPRPPDGEVVVAFRSFSTLGIREGYRFRGRMPHGPHVRMPTHRSRHFWPRRR